MLIYRVVRALGSFDRRQDKFDKIIWHDINFHGGLFQVRGEVQRAADPDFGGGRVQLQAAAGLQAGAGAQYHAGRLLDTAAVQLTHIGRKLNKPKFYQKY